MSGEGYDFSWGRPGGAAIVAAGRSFVVRYIRPGDGRSLTAAEVADYRDHGLAIALVFEADANRALDGRAAGRADAKVANDRALALGFPIEIPFYFAVDFDAQPSHYARIDDYLRGCADVIGTSRVGVYGHRDLMAHCAAEGTASLFWQTLAWSGGRVYSGNHLYQYQTGSTGAKPINGAAVDLNRAMKADYGQWDPQETDMAEIVPFTAPIPFEVVPATTRSFSGTAPYPELGAVAGPVLVDATVFITGTGTPHGALVRIVTGASGRRLVAAAAVAPVAAPPVDTTPLSQADCDAQLVPKVTAAVNAALDHVESAATAFATAIAEARVR